MSTLDSSLVTSHSVTLIGLTPGTTYNYAVISTNPAGTVTSANASLVAPVGPTFADFETPGGIIDGTNNEFTLVNAPLGSSLLLFRNGLYMKPGSDYTLAGTTITFETGAVPQPGDTLAACYLGVH